MIIVLLAIPLSACKGFKVAVNVSSSGKACFEIYLLC